MSLAGQPNKQLVGTSRGPPQNFFDYLVPPLHASDYELSSKRMCLRLGVFRQLINPHIAVQDVVRSPRHSAVVDDCCLVNIMD